MSGGVKTVVERMAESDRIKKTDGELIELARIKEVLAWASENVVLVERKESGWWYCLCKQPNQKPQPTLYEALHTAWEKRDE